MYDICSVRTKEGNHFLWSNSKSSPYCKTGYPGDKRGKDDDHIYMSKRAEKMGSRLLRGLDEDQGKLLFVFGQLQDHL
ncbi:hypothetical protein NPIL_209761 [Nephila pilipes]|uniref:Uncharacterized protein n=1 Tax=Nephila pilipes TaxID=299642 RepID=A0A8X6PCW7_NEPPI|nr:hypothetical protein NPIL_209761 [Nephila pilipes]